MTLFEQLRADFKTLTEHTLTLAQHANGVKDGFEALKSDLTKQIDDRFDTFEQKLDDAIELRLASLLDEKLGKQLDHMKTEFFGSSDGSTSEALDKVGDKVGQLGTSTITGGSDSIVGGAGNDSVTITGGTDTVFGGGHDTIEGADTVSGEPETGLDPSTGLPATK